MKKTTIIEAIGESQRFVQRARAYLKLIEHKKKDYEYVYDHPKESGMVRHTSLILTRVLAKMRQNK